MDNGLVGVCVCGEGWGTTPLLLPYIAYTGGYYTYIYVCYGRAVYTEEGKERERENVCMYACIYMYVCDGLWRVERTGVRRLIGPHPIFLVAHTYTH